MIEKREGEWIVTFSGIHFYPLDPREDEILVMDIAHALSNIARFNGHTKYFYSVAQHSLFVSKELEHRGYSPYVCLAGLLHDGSEAYICDIPTPLKNMLPDYKRMELHLQNTIYKALAGRTPIFNECVLIKIADRDALFAEALALTRERCWIDYEPTTRETIIEVEDHIKVGDAFIDRYYELIKAVKADATK
jgi:uncharacterized protein